MKKPIAIIISILITINAKASDSELKGLWYEAYNYPASSVLRFEKFGNGWAGRYVQVSPAQTQAGFAVGEMIIRGKLKANEFTGEVLLKGVSEYCKNAGAGWTPIKMKLNRTELSGVYLSSVIDYRNNCQILSQHWETYRLTALPKQ